MSEALVYIQLQNNLPQCLWSSLKKARQLYDGDIYLITPEREMHYEIFKALNIKALPKEKIKHRIIDEYEANTYLTKLYPGWDGFWDNACKRFVYFYVFQQMLGIEKAIQIETDVVPYRDIGKMFLDFDVIYGKKIVFVPHADYQLNAGLMYSGSIATMEKFSNYLIEYFKQGPEFITKKYPTQAIVNETNLAYQFKQDCPDLVDVFPALPEDAHAAELGYLIDPDAWGRWVDGVRYSPGTPYTAPIYYIGQKILDGTYEVHFSFDGRKKRMPYVHNKKTGGSVPLATLHFNSKEPEPWI
jgi:hypothetical protein